VKKLAGLLALFACIYLVTFCRNNGCKQTLAKEDSKKDTSKTPLRTTEFEEHFKTNKLKNWEIQRYSFSENGCEMQDSQVTIDNSSLTLTVELNDKNKSKPFKGGEISSLSPFLYGKFTVRLKNNIAPGTVSSFFLMNKWQPLNWEHKEIDIEFLGKNSKEVQFTVHHFKNKGNKHELKAHTYLLGFDSTNDFHEYSILWEKEKISWLIDGKLVYSENNILIDEEMYVRLNHWACNPSNKETLNWMGKIDTLKFPSKVYYDYIRYIPTKQL
jgi:endo-1,3-1,4-beta-glycanase ExoK